VAQSNLVVTEGVDLVACRRKITRNLVHRIPILGAGLGQPGIGRVSLRLPTPAGGCER